MLRHKGTCELKTGRLILRKYCPDDAYDMFRNWANDQQVCEYMSWNPHETFEQSRQKVDKWINEYQNEDNYHWVIEFDGQAIGDIAVRDFSDAGMWCDVGYCIGRNFWGKGIATEALCAVIDFLFDRVGFNRVGAWHEEGNDASGRVMQKAGMSFEGTAREKDIRRNGEFCNMKMYAVLKKDRQNNAKINFKKNQYSF